jgi:formylmethanofuran dehydrogenase subunit E
MEDLTMCEKCEELFQSVDLFKVKGKWICNYCKHNSNDNLIENMYARYW